MQDIELTGKRVLVRVDFNVPRNKTTGEITNDVRIQAGAPTIKYLADQGAKVIVMTHMGRPKDDSDPILRLDKVAARLAEIIGQPVKKLDAVVGPEVEAAVAAMYRGFNDSCKESRHTNHYKRVFTFTTHTEFYTNFR